MKRLLILGTIGLLMLNALGYYPVYLCMQLKAQVEMKERLDSHSFGEDELFTIKIPLQLPYWTENRQAPERIEGQIRYNDEFYKLYKQELVGDTLVVLAVKDHTEKAIFDTLTEWVKITITGLPGTSQKASGWVSHLIKDYFSLQNRTYYYLYEWMAGTLPIQVTTPFYSTPTFLILSPPPELIG